MISMADVIVGLWFVPVTLYIIIPLAMLAGWVLGRIGYPVRHRQTVPEKKEEITFGGEQLARAGA